MLSFRTLLASVFILWATVSHAAGSLKITLGPSAAVTAGAQWQVDGGIWRTSGTTAKNLSAGSHVVGFKAVNGWITPAALTVTVVNGATTSRTVTYVQAASLSVALTPATAEWRLGAGPWQPSGARVSNLAPGTYTLSYSGVTGWETPGAEMVTLTAGQNAALSRAYVQSGQVQIALSPSTGQYRIDGGSWLSSGAATYVAPGVHRIEYGAVEFYDPPADETISVAGGELFTATRSYTSQRPTLTVNLTPSTAQWRLAGGAWQPSGATATELAVGDHLLEFEDIGGDFAPLAAEGVTLGLREHATIVRAYSLKPASLTVVLSPADSTGQWRINGGAWLASSATLADLAPGTYTVDYASVEGFLAPGSEAVTLGAGSAQSLFRSYVPDVATLTTYPVFEDVGNETMIIAARDGELYGVSAAGGSAYAGQVFTVKGDGTGFKVLKAFTNNVGAAHAPTALLEGSDGVLYGVTRSIGTASAGTVFRLNKDGTGFATLWTFATGIPAVDLKEGSDGFLYGATAGTTSTTRQFFRLAKSGGAVEILRYEQLAFAPAADGAVYATSPSGNGSILRFVNGLSTQLRAFTNTPDGAAPRSAPVLASNGLLYGTTSAGGTANRGTLYRLSPTGTDYTVLKHFEGGALDGATPETAPVQAADGFLYGLTMSGGNKNAGTLYRIAADGSGYQVLHHFSLGTTDGARPRKPLALGVDGTLFGTTSLFGGDSFGTIFRFDPTLLALTPVKSLGAPAGAAPRGIVEGSDGRLYGVTRYGGGTDDGVLFSVQPDGSDYKVVQAFRANQLGWFSYAGLIEGPDGALYGATAAGGLSDGTGGGVLFRITKDGGDVRALHTFASPGPATPLAQPTFGSDGVLYGTTGTGGTLGGYGALYRVNADGTDFAVLRSFAVDSTEGNTPADPLVEGPDGRLYGTLNSAGAGGRGSVFVMGKDGSDFAVLHAFAGGAGDGAVPAGRVTFASDGRIYGVTSRGGTFDAGVLYVMNADGSGFSLLKSLQEATDGGAPAWCGLVEATGYLYGQTGKGGPAGGGTVFRIRPDGTGFAVRASFDLAANTGALPTGQLVLGRSGVLYGVTFWGGAGGTVYKLETP